MKKNLKWRKPKDRTSYCHIHHHPFPSVGRSVCMSSLTDGTNERFKPQTAIIIYKTTQQLISFLVGQREDLAEFKGLAERALPTLNLSISVPTAAVDHHHRWMQMS